MKRRLEYAFSATGYLALPTKELIEKDPNHKLYPRYAECFQKLRESNVDFENIDAEYSFLANGYMESTRIENYFAKQSFGYDNFYVDSGGLQMANLGIPITEEAKQEVYRVSTFGDFGFCFDEIPLHVDKTMGISTKNTRSSVEDKIFIRGDAEEKAKRTGRNVNKQCTTYRTMGAKTKAIIIIQGNTIDDMVKFFEDTLSAIDKENYPYIAGTALADTCMGNGPLQSADMIAAWRAIYEKLSKEGTLPAFFTNHLHLLGVGAFYRFEPFINLMRSGFIPPEVKVSADSSKHSMAYHIGFWNGAGNSKKYGLISNPFNRRIYSKVYDEFDFVCRDFFKTKDEYVSFFTRHVKSLNDQYDAVGGVENGDQEMIRFIRFNVFLHSISQMREMFGAFDRIISGTYKPEKVDLPVYDLQNVRDFEDYGKWRKKVTDVDAVRSNAMRSAVSVTEYEKKEEDNSLARFFEAAE
jgi:hypothetical protein